MQNRTLSLLLAFCMFSTGASGLVNEYVLATITTYILGNSIEQFSIVIASMMLMMGVSGFVQQKISDDNLVGKFLAIEILMALLGGFAPLIIYAAFAYFEAGFYLVHYFFVLAIGFLIGFEIPIVMRIIDQQKVTLKKNLTLVYAMDYVGAFIGAMIWVKVLLINFPLTQISFIVAGFNFAIALITILYFVSQGAVRRPLAAVLVSGVTAVSLAIGFGQNQELSSLLEQRFYDDPIVHKETSRYQHLVLTQSKKDNDIRLYINGNTQFSSIDEQRYHEFLVHPAMALNTGGKHVLILGGGDGLALREVLKYPRVESVTLIDLDPAMVKLAATHPLMRQLNQEAFQDARLIVEKPGGLQAVDLRDVYLTNESDKFAEKHWAGVINVINVDADSFLDHQQSMRWDTVIIDFPDPGSVELAKLYSRQFYHKLRQHLAPNATVAIQSTSPFHAKEAYLAIGATLRASGFEILPFRQNIPSFGDWGFHLAWSDDAPARQARKSIKELEQFEVDTAFITPDLLAASLVFGKGELTPDVECINTVLNPCLVANYTKHSWKVE